MESNSVLCNKQSKNVHGMAIKSMSGSIHPNYNRISSKTLSSGGANPSYFTLDNANSMTVNKSNVSSQHALRPGSRFEQGSVRSTQSTGHSGWIQVHQV